MKVDQGLCLGVLVNPYAGLGGSVALKGSDGVQTRDEALRRGAEPQAPGRMSRALKALSAVSNVSVLTWGGDMGENSCRAANVPCTVIGESPMPSSQNDTRAAAAALKAAGAELILFAGGDGTARDLVDAIGLGTPVLGVPAGCKMHSAVYAVNPEAAGSLLAELAGGGLVALESAEVRDIDEAAFREGVVKARHYGELQVPAEARYLQQVKCGGREVEDLVVTEVAAWVADSLEDDTWYLMGSGSTVAVVMEQLGLDNTLLGVDLVRNGEVVAADLGARQLLEHIGDAPAKAVITVIGGQGHLFGRGNQQFSPALIRRLGKENIQILATRTKLETLEGRPLLVDSGDAKLDKQLCGLWPVTTGYEDQILYRVGTNASLIEG
ncbi:ATP-NAD kinase family protein [Alcanivorax sp.]|uniref:ATP-NAD kinase family protein n=1 Tax=Alcanivorax sp. TaxID=1872427 RepID=UPI0025C2D238|nr:ATP-NAD kinase family protein [Alcanivorax sp.]